MLKLTHYGEVHAQARTFTCAPPYLPLGPEEIEDLTRFPTPFIIGLKR
jgi:hypothetical protein